MDHGRLRWAITSVGITVQSWNKLLLLGKSSKNNYMAFWTPSCSILKWKKANESTWKSCCSMKFFINSKRTFGWLITFFILLLNMNVWLNKILLYQQTMSTNPSSQCNAGANISFHCWSDLAWHGIDCRRQMKKILPLHKTTLSVPEWVLDYQLELTKYIDQGSIEFSH